MKQILFYLLLLSVSPSVFGQIHDTGNNVGIGTTSPAFKLQIITGSNFDRSLGFTNASGLLTNRSSLIYTASGSGSGIFQLAGNLLIQPRTTAARGIYFNTNNGNNTTTRFAIDPSGEIGIGTDAPDAMLDIHAKGDEASILKLNTDRAWVFKQVGSGSGAQLALRSLAGGKSFYIQDYQGNSNFKFQSQTGESYFKGNMGIGTETPTEKLEIQNGRFKINSGAAVLHMYESDHDKNWFFVADGNQLQIRQNTTSSSNTALAIKDDFNVGIGTTNPDHKLDVKGTVHAEEVLVDLNVPGPDYVFEPDYNLLNLPALEQYLKTNKHLPEVPSAKEMEQEGVNVVEMEMLLLKKVEELTLHIIELEKRIKELEK